MPSPSPFHLDQRAAYRRWRAAKLDALARMPAPACVRLGRPSRPGAAQRAQLLASVAAHGMARYRLARVPDTQPALEAQIEQLCASLGLGGRERTVFAPGDAMTRIEVAPGEVRGEYLPYTNRAIGWHTDGTYAQAGPVRAFLLHCVRPAARGGGSRMLDPELVYLHMRDEAPRELQTLMQPDMLTIPANVAGGRELRAAARVPVFEVLADGGLVLRYTARVRHVQWRDDGAAQAALGALRACIEGLAARVVRCRLEAGEGVLCNNVLHTRDPFEDATPGRLLLRARYRLPLPATLADSAGHAARDARAGPAGDAMGRR